ncbi:AAA-ATPase [Stenotrophomonas phage Summit]|nr:AAA-ATPase [Stenotrophomonas phage Summit]
MDMLKLAVQARIPFVTVKTDDLIYSTDVLDFITGEKSAPFFPDNLGPDLSQLALPDANVLWTSLQIESKELYLKLQIENKTLVFINPPKASTLHFNAGQLLPPRDMIHKVLKDTFKVVAKADELIGAFGGLTLKDTHELIQMSVEEWGDATPKMINDLRQSYVTKLKGMVQVDTTQDYYAVPKYLSKWLDENIMFFTDDVAETLRPRGLLFDGPPGTGKTAASKAIANKLGMPLFRLDVGGMKGKYVGDSEGNLNAALQAIDQLAPCVVIFDEIEKMFGEHHDGGTTASMLGTLLWWLQEHKSKVLSIMTTNNKSALPPELYREGRIDQTMMFKGLETSEEVTGFIHGQLEAVLKKVKIEDVDALRNLLHQKVKLKPQPVTQVSLANLINEEVKAQFLKEKKK